MISTLKKKLNKKGFTLAELLIVVAIIAVLVAIAIPVFGSAIGKAQHATNLANIRAAYAEEVVNEMTKNTYSGGDITIDVDNLKKVIPSDCKITCTNGDKIVVKTGTNFTDNIDVDDDVKFTSNNEIAGTKS